MMNEKAQSQGATDQRTTTVLTAELVRLQGIERAVRYALSKCPYCVINQCRADAHQWLRDALQDTDEEAA